jgi:nitrate reductase gamma subunit
MSPMEKESAFLHLPTYAAGMLYHLGIFSSLLFFVWVIITKFANVTLPSFITTTFAVFLVITSLAGFSILIKRVISKELRYLSCADDYISNFLTTISLAATALYIFVPGSEAIYFVTMALLFTWMPLGKTRHLLYFFFARVHLGFFYGRRGAWPTVKKS